MIHLNKLLELYLDRVNLIKSYFLMKFGYANPLKQYWQGNIKRTGILEFEHKIEYSFHGSGCTVEFANGEIVSFDFLEDDTITFDLFKFRLFVESLPGGDDRDMDELFNRIELVRVGESWIVNELS